MKTAPPGGRNGNYGTQLTSVKPNDEAKATGDCIATTAVATTNNQSPTVDDEKDIVYTTDHAVCTVYPLSTSVIGWDRPRLAGTTARRDYRASES